MLSEAKLKEYGNLGKPINVGKYYVPCLNQLTLQPEMMLKAKQQESMEIEMMKEYNKQVKNHPKLYGLIRQHMSLESKDEVAKEKDYKQWHTDASGKVVVSCINMCRTTALSENMCPSVLFTGVPVNYKK
jgi:hypothetical protein